MPDVLGRYRLMKLLSTGGMGEVFLARQEGPAGFAKTVVVKRVLRHLAKDQGFIDLFLNEAQLAAQLQHPNIAQIYGLEREGEAWFIAMEYVHGRSVRDVLDVARTRGLAMPPTVAARLASQALQGLHSAHQLTDSRGKPLGIIHRDVTPENLLVSFSGLVKLVDFGIARAMTGAGARVGRPKGKVGYMAPELMVSGSRLDGRADLYGVGVVLYEMLRLARPPNVPGATGDAVASERKPYEHDPAVPPGLNDILAKALAPDPQDRFSSAGAMSEALESWLVDQGQTVLSSDITAFLEALYGRDVIEANPAVLPLSPSDQPSIAASVLGGTQPLSALPLGDFEPSQIFLRPLPFVRARSAHRGRALGIAALIGAVALAVTALGVRVARGRHGQTTAGGGAAAQAVKPARPGGDGGPAVRAPYADGGVDAAAEGIDLSASDHSGAGGGEVDEADEADDELSDRRSSTRPRHKKTRTGRVLVRVIAGAEVFYAGKSLGITPIDPVEVPVGHAVFVLRHRKLGVTRRVVVRVPIGGVVVLRADFSRR